MKRKAVFIHSEMLERNVYPAGCPFDTSRAGKVKKTLASMGLLSGENRSLVTAERTDEAIVEKFHSKRYLDCLRNVAEGKYDVGMLGMGIGGPDCPIFAEMYEHPFWACGATLAGANLILSGQADIAFNPSGGFHHAKPELAAGFCYINDVALACMILSQAGKRVLYLDVDVHHGDGVAEAFYDTSDVMTISFHQNGKTLFPGTGFENEKGKGNGKGYCVNVPLPPGTYDQIYQEAFDQITLPLIEFYDPDVIVFELGVDGLAGDPLAHFQLTNNFYADIIYRVMKFGKPILMTGGGGYNVANTVRAWSLAWTVVCGADAENQHANIGLGGVMLETTDWHGGLRDRQLIVDEQQRQIIDGQIRKTIEVVKTNIFSLHRI